MEKEIEKTSEDLQRIATDEIVSEPDPFPNIFGREKGSGVTPLPYSFWNETRQSLQIARQS